MLDFLAFLRYYCFEVHLSDSLLIRGQLEGAIDPETFRLVANLYTRVPLRGRVLITPVSGNLKESIQLSVNAILASGNVDLRLFGKNVRSIVDLDVKFVGKIREDYQLLTLPCVLVLCPESNLLMIYPLDADSRCSNKYNVT